MTTSSVNNPPPAAARTERQRSDAVRARQQAQQATGGDPHGQTQSHGPPQIGTHDDISGLQRGMQTQRHEANPKAVGFPDKGGPGPETGASSSEIGNRIPLPTIPSKLPDGKPPVSKQPPLPNPPVLGEPPFPMPRLPQDPFGGCEPPFPLPIPPVDRDPPGGCEPPFPLPIPPLDRDPPLPLPPLDQDPPVPIPPGDGWPEDPGICRLPE